MKTWITTFEYSYPFAALQYTMCEVEQFIWSTTLLLRLLTILTNGICQSKHGSTGPCTPMLLQWSSWYKPISSPGTSFSDEYQLKPHQFYDRDKPSHRIKTLVCNYSPIHPPHHLPTTLKKRLLRPPFDLGYILVVTSHGISFMSLLMHVHG